MCTSLNGAGRTCKDDMERRPHTDAALLDQGSWIRLEKLPNQLFLRPGVHFGVSLCDDMKR